MPKIEKSIFGVCVWNGARLSDVLISLVVYMIVRVNGLRDSLPNKMANSIKNMSAKNSTAKAIQTDTDTRACTQTNKHSQRTAIRYEPNLLPHRMH